MTDNELRTLLYQAHEHLKAGRPQEAERLQREVARAIIDELRETLEGEALLEAAMMRLAGLQMTP